MKLSQHSKAEVTSTLSGILIVLVALVTLAVGSIYKSNQVKKLVEQQAYLRAQENINRVEQEFTVMVELVESALRNNMWSARALVSHPDSLRGFTRGIVKDNPFIYGSAIALVENYSPRRTGRLFAPYSYRDKDRVRSIQLGTEEYDYPHHEWFTQALTAGEKGHWSEPYFDEGGGNELMTTYSVPVYDHKGNLAAVLTADVSLDWVSDRLAAINDYPYALKILVSKSGTIMATSPSNVGMNNRNIMEVAAGMEDSQGFMEVNRGMLAGEEGAKVVHLRGHEYHVFYDKVQKTGWSMSVSIPEEEIFSEVRAMNRMGMGIQLIGMAMLVVILLVTVTNQRKMMKINEKKSRMDSELKVASGIQMAMVPKVFPPFPDRKDIDIYATLIPAKEVGGDLYDYFIRDERLYFCIGDVSGKGVPASLVMAVTRSLFRTVSGHEKSPQRIVATMNRNMTEMNVNDMFVTFFCGVLDLTTGHLRYCNAGHNAPVYLRADGSEQLPVTPNIPLGILEGHLFSEQEVDMEAGSTIFLYTDGLNEAEDIIHGQFGMERVMKRLDASLPAEGQVTQMLASVQNFVGKAPQSDDLTLLVIRYLNDNPMETTERHLILHNDIQQIPQLAEFVEKVASLAHLDSGLSLSLNLALEEAVTNVILYAYPEGADGLVDVEAIIRPDQLQFLVTDSGKPFDPTAAPEADITLDVEDRPIGGLGIFLIRNIMDNVYYKRVDGKNILTMSKNLL